MCIIISFYCAKRDLLSVFAVTPPAGVWIEIYLVCHLLLCQTCHSPCGSLESVCRFFTEKNCLEIVCRDRDKGIGIEEICGWVGISTEDVLSVGNDKEDEAMKQVCGGYVRI